MKIASQVALTPIYQREKPVRNPPYMRFVKRFPCVACGSSWSVDPCHTGAHALGTKGSDLDVLPLCRTCHAAYDAGPAAFVARYQLDVPALIYKFNQAWEAKQRKTA